MSPLLSCPTCGFPGVWPWHSRDLDCPADAAEAQAREDAVLARERPPPGEDEDAARNA